MVDIHVLTKLNSYRLLSSSTPTTSSYGTTRAPLERFLRRACWEDVAPALMGRVPEHGQESIGGACTHRRDPDADGIDDDNQSRVSEKHAPEGQFNPRLKALSDISDVLAEKVNVKSDQLGILSEKIDVLLKILDIMS